MKKVVSYVRVSSEKQVEQGLSIPAQTKAIQKYAQENGLTIIREFIDEAETAKSVNRPKFLEMISCAKKNHTTIDGILVWKFSRFARSREDSVIYKSLLNKVGVPLISITEGVDDTPSGKMLEGIIEVMDEFYSNNLAQETKRGMVENATRGHSNGGACPYGYQRVTYEDNGRKRTRFEIQNIQAPVVKRMFAMSDKNVGCLEIARSLNSGGTKTAKGKLWSGSRVHGILTNEKYTGTYVWNKKSNNPEEVIRVENAHPAIIDRQLFARVQNKLAQRDQSHVHPRTINSKYLLSDILYCEKCGSKMFGCGAKSGAYEYYECNTMRNKGAESCDSKRLPRQLLENHVIEKLKTHVLTEENLTSLVKMVNEIISKSSAKHERSLKEIETNLEDLINKRLKLYQVLETTELGYEHLAPRIMDLCEQIAALEETKFSIEVEKNSPKPSPLNASIVKGYVEDLQGLLSDGTIIQQKSFLRSFVKKIVVGPTEITVEYTVPLELENGRKGKKESSSMVAVGRRLYLQR